MRVGPQAQSRGLLERRLGPNSGLQTSLNLAREHFLNHVTPGPHLATQGNTPKSIPEMAEGRQSWVSSKALLRADSEIPSEPSRCTLPQQTEACSLTSNHQGSGPYLPQRGTAKAVYTHLLYRAWVATCYILVTTLPSVRELGGVGTGPNNSGVGFPSIKKEAGYRRSAWPWTWVRWRSRQHAHLLEKKNNNPGPYLKITQAVIIPLCSERLASHPWDQLAPPSFLLFSLFEKQSALKALQASGTCSGLCTSGCSRQLYYPSLATEACKTLSSI